jgi:DNA-binding beta-propeller fold protein YncE
VADSGNNRIQKFTSDGIFIAKWGSVGSGDGQFYDPSGIAVDGYGNVYVADSGNNRIQKFTSDGIFIAKWGSYGSGDGQLLFPFGIAVDGFGNVYVLDQDNVRIQKFTSTGGFITKWGSYGSGDGQFNWPWGIAVDGSGNVYVADSGNDRIQKFTSSGGFITKWGSRGSRDGQFNYPWGIAVDGSGNVYVADTYNATIGSTSAVIDSFLQSGAIDNAGTANSLKAKLDDAQKKIDQGNIKAAENILQAFINEVEAQSGKHITTEVAEILITDARYVIEHLPTAAPVIIEIPKKSWLGQNVPNPFNPDTWIPYGLHERADVIISIYSASGRLVRTLHLGQKDAGLYVSKDKAAYWDGRNDAGEEVSSGIYFVTMKAGEFVAIRKTVILK